MHIGRDPHDIPDIPLLHRAQQIGDLDLSAAGRTVVALATAS